MTESMAARRLSTRRHRLSWLPRPPALRRDERPSQKAPMTGADHRRASTVSPPSLARFPTETCCGGELPQEVGDMLRVHVPSLRRHTASNTHGSQGTPPMCLPTASPHPWTAVSATGWRKLILLSPCGGRCHPSPRPCLSPTAAPKIHSQRQGGDTMRFFPLNPKVRREVESGEPSGALGRMENPSTPRRSWRRSLAPPHRVIAWRESSKSSPEH